MTWKNLDYDAMDVSEHQLTQIKVATSGPIGILSGGPGCGKSWSTVQILENFDGYSLVVAPTGKAASRIREINPSVNCSTIHSALEPDVSGRGGGKWGFIRNRSFPLDADLIIADEYSMCSVDLHADLLQAVKRGTKLLFVGDPHQLSPVGHGKPFVDMIDAGIPHGHLNEIWRFAGRIAHVCRDIKDGKPWTPSPKLDIDALPPENFIHIESSAAAIPIKLKSFVQQFIDKGYGIDQIQVIAPCNTSGDLSRERINTMMQNWFNENGEVVIAPSNSKCGFRMDDRVMCLENQWAKKYGSNDEDEVTNSGYVANGDTGTIVKMAKGKGDKIQVICRFPCGVCVFDSAKFRDQFTLAYCVTGHKAQGSSWPIVIVIGDDSSGAKMVTDRCWFYTVFSRASKACISLGSKSSILQACRTARIEHRKTFLSSEIRRQFSALTGT